MQRMHNMQVSRVLSERRPASKSPIFDGFDSPEKAWKVKKTFYKILKKFLKSFQKGFLKI